MGLQEAADLIYHFFQSAQIEVHIAPLADRFYVMEHGKIVEHFNAGELETKMPVLHELLGV